MRASLAEPVAPARKLAAAPRLAVAPRLDAPARRVELGPASLERPASCACGGGCPICAARDAAPNAQPRLAVGRADDRSEREADRVADAVVADGTRAGEPPTIHHLTPAPAMQPDMGVAPDPAFAGALAAESRGGQALEPATRAAFELRFGRDLSGVRVHSGPRAAALSRGIAARAFTHANHVFFASSQPDSRSAAGRRLLAHELTHVAQQRGAGGVLQRQPEGAGATGTMRPATPADRREFARTAAEFLERQGDFFADQPGRALEDILGHLRTTAENGLRAIGGVEGAEVEAEAIRSAYREAVRVVLVSRAQAETSPGREPPTVPELFERHRDAILSFALPQHRADPGAGALSDELSAALPAGASPQERARHAAIVQARQRLRVVTSAVDLELQPLFDVRGGRMTVGLPANTVVRLAGNVPATLQHGLRNVAAQLVDSPLTANTTVMLALDLSRFGGGYESYRFTRLDLGPPSGTEILVERQGAVGVEGLRSEERDAMRARFDRLGFNRAGFSTDEFDQVLIGLSQVPEAQLSTLRGLRFARDSVDATVPAAAANYDQTTHTITVFDRAFTSGLTRLGTGARPLKLAATSVVHEVGHALDLGALRTAATATEAAQQALLAEFGTGGTGYRIPARGDSDRARYDELNAAVSAAQRAETAARARSGARWRGGTVTDALARGAREPAFRQAAIRDGARPDDRGFPTTYPNVDSFWQEYFAEAFTLYQTSPDLLQRMRPNVFAYMQGEFPAPAPAVGRPGP